MALWLLWKQHSKERQKQQQQQQEQLQQQQADAVTLQEQTQMTRPGQQTQGAEGGNSAADLATLSLDGVTGSSTSEQDGSCSGPRVYSRDEIAQMLVQGKLTGMTHMSAAQLHSSQLACSSSG